MLCSTPKSLMMGLAFAASVPAAASAATPASGIENAAIPVSDAQLAEMRGKYVGPGNITYFGVQMQTSLQRPDGITTAATLQLNINMPNGTSSTVGTTGQLLVNWSHDGDPRMDVAGQPAGMVISVPAGLASVQGAVQSQQIAGNDNMVSNGMTIAVAPASTFAPSSMQGTAISGSETHDFGNGDSLRFVAEKNQVGIVISGGLDQVRQMVDGGAGQAAQNVTLNSNGNAVRNNMAISVGYSGADPASTASLQTGISALKGWSY